MTSKIHFEFNWPLEAEKIALADLLYLTLEIYNILVCNTNYLPIYIHTIKICGGGGIYGSGKLIFWNLHNSFYYYLYEKVNLTLADHLISLAEAKPRKVGKSTYKSMNELLNAIKESGYNPEEDSPVAKVSSFTVVIR